MQNHLTQILALVAMEQPLSLSATHILQEKIKVLSSVRPLARKDLVVGQYAGYLDEDSISNKASRTETFAVAVLHINNPRWAGVPFVLKAGKALNENRTEVRIRFKPVPGAIPELASCPENELIIRVQPNEGIYWKIQNKVPGLHFQVAPMRMDLTYQSKYAKEDLPEAYERLILHVLHADKSHFVHADELTLSWHIFSAVLRELEEAADDRPVAYMRGTRGPALADELAQRYGMRKFGSQRFESNTAPQSAGGKGAQSDTRWTRPSGGKGASAHVALPSEARSRLDVPPPRNEWPGSNPLNIVIPSARTGSPAASPHFAGNQANDSEQAWSEETRR
jgi:glucose-6-phosphate 1-dehydrogenase